LVQVLQVSEAYVVIENWHAEEDNWRSGIVAFREIRRYQESTNLLLLKAPFQRFVRGIMDGITQKPVRFTSSALQALQVASEN